MKYNIRKFQGGGFASFTPIIAAPPVQAVQPKQTKTEKKEGLLSKDVYDQLLADGGLVNDVNAFVAELAKLESGPASFLNADNRMSALRSFAKINEIRSNQDSWNKSLAAAKASGGLGEVAIDINGGYFVQDGKEIKKVSFKSYQDAEEKPQVMTVSQLLEARRHLPQLTNNSHVLSVASGAIGLNEITNHVQKIMETLSEGSAMSENYYDKGQIREQIKMLTGVKPTAQIQEALSELNVMLNTPGEYLKVHIKESGKRKNVDIALNYIWGTLGKPAQLKLEGVSLMNGESDPTKYLQRMLFSYTEPKTEKKYTPESDAGIHGSTSALKSINNFQAFHKDVLRDPLTKFVFNDPTLGVLFRGAIGAVGPLLTEDDKVIPMTTMGTIMTKLGLSKIVEQSNMYFGDKEVDAFTTDAVIYDGQEVAKVYMPVNEEGAPDYEEFQHFKEIYKQYEENKDSMSIDAINNLFLENGYNIEVGTDKVIRDNTKVKPFLVMYGYTNSATNLIDDNDFVKKLTSAEDNLVVPRLESIWTMGTGKNAVNITPEKSWHREKYYKGIIAIAYRNAHTALVDMAANQGAKAALYTVQQVQKNIKHSRQPQIKGTGDASLLTQQ